MKGKRMLATAVAVLLFVGIMAPLASAADSKKSFFDSVIRYISFDTDANDYMGNIAEATDVTIAEGKYGNAGAFNGTTSQINLGQIPVPQGTSFTVGYWIKPIADGNADAVVVGNKDWDSGSNQGWTTGIYNNAIKANIGYNSSDTEKLANTTTYSFSGSEWVYFTAVFDMSLRGTSNVTVYINGVEYSKKRVTAGDIETSLDTFIGRDSAAATRFYNGMLDEFILCNRVLTVAEIQYAMQIGENGATFAEQYAEMVNSDIFELAESSGTMQCGEQVQIPLECQGAGINASDAVYQSSDESVATISSDGTISALAMGNTVISVTYNNGTISYSGTYALSVTGKSYRMEERPDKSANPSTDGWSFMYAPTGTNDFAYMTSYTESGDIWRKGLTGNDQYVRLNGTGYGHHPGASDDVVLKWTAPERGCINIKGNIIAVAYSSTNTDGVNLTITKNNDTESPIAQVNVSFDNDFQNGGKNVDQNVIVDAGDEIYFRIDHDVNNSADGFNFDPVITYVKEEAGISLKKDSVVLKVGEETVIPVEVTGDVDTSRISYASVNAAVADVDETGKVTAKQMGTTLIKVTYDDNGVTYSGAYLVTVIGAQYQMSTRADKNSNPSSEGWGFVYVPVGTNSYVPFEKHSTTSDEWSTDVEGFTRIGGDSTNCHPGVNHDVAISWTAPTDGYVNLAGHFENTNTATSDGVKMTVLLGNETLLSAIANNNGGYDLDKIIAVKQGETVYFRFNCIAGNGSDHFTFDPIITYTNGTIETGANKYLVKVGSQMELSIDDPTGITAVSADDNIASVSVADGVKIVGVSVGETKILLSQGDHTKAVTVTVADGLQPYTFSFNGAQETNSGATCRIFTHLNTGSSNMLISSLSFNVLFDKDVVEMLDYKGNPVTAVNAAGVYAVSASPGKTMSSDNKYDADATVINSFYLRVKDDSAEETLLQITAPVINGVAVDEALCTINNRNLIIHTNPA